MFIHVTLITKRPPKISKIRGEGGVICAPRAKHGIAPKNIDRKENNRATCYIFKTIQIIRTGNEIKFNDIKKEKKSACQFCYSKG